MSSHQHARLPLQLSEFQTVWSIKILFIVNCLKRTKLTKKMPGWLIKKINLVSKLCYNQRRKILAQGTVERYWSKCSGISPYQPTNLMVSHYFRSPCRRRWNVGRRVMDWRNVDRIIVPLFGSSSLVIFVFLFLPVSLFLSLLFFSSKIPFFKSASFWVCF